MEDNLVIDFLDKNALTVVIVLLILIAAEILVIALSGKRKHGRYNQEEQSLVLKELSQDGTQIQILIRRVDHVVIFVSRNIENILGIKAENVYADLYVLETLLEEKERWRVKKSLEEQKKDQSMREEEITVSLPNQPGSRSIKFICRPTSDGEYLLILLEDISKEQEVREDLKKQIAEVQAIDESKTLFLSKMSHEIRTPMNGMLGMITLAKISQQNSEYTEANDYLDKAEGLTQFLLSIINDILDMSRIESGKLELEHAE
ncbi:MAG: hypothetical protein EOM18_16235, partial [Clostridia bacterium]|nr:hypothetical protein [Clostridia bacterium]